MKMLVVSKQVHSSTTSSQVHIIRSRKFNYKSSMMATTLAVNDGVGARSEMVRRLACSSAV
jgi:hypothetical protein